MLGLNAIRKIITDRCEFGYVLVDDCAFSLIPQEAVEDMGSGVFVAKFRLPIERKHALMRVTHLVCGDIGSEEYVFVKQEVEYGIPYLDCIWVIAPDPESEFEVKNV